MEYRKWTHTFIHTDIQHKCDLPLLVCSCYLEEKHIFQQAVRMAQRKNSTALKGVNQFHIFFLAFFQWFPLLYLLSFSPLPSTIFFSIPIFLPYSSLLTALGWITSCLVSYPLIFYQTFSFYPSIFILHYFFPPPFYSFLSTFTLLYFHTILPIPYFPSFPPFLTLFTSFLSYFYKTNFSFQLFSLKIHLPSTLIPLFFFLLLPCILTFFSALI